MIKRLMAIGLLCISSTVVNAQTASSNFNNADARFAIDGDPSTRWTTETAQENGMFFQLDFGSTRSISGLQIDSRGSRANDTPAAFTILVSNNGSNFDSVFTGNGDTDGTTTVNFSAVNARYLRVLQTGSRSNSWWSIHEISVPGNIVQLRQRSSSSHALATNNGAERGQNVFMFTENKNDPNQQFVEIARGDGGFTYQKNGTNFCLDGGNRGANGQNLYLWTCDISNGNQIWVRETISSADNIFKLIKSNSQNFAIDGRNNASNRSNVVIYDRNATPNENLQWIIDPI